MASKVKLTVSLAEPLVREIRAECRRTSKPRSQIVAEALELWRRKRLERELREGYQAMAGDDAATAETAAAATWEVVR